MSKIRPVKPGEMARALEKRGFQRIRQRGNHAVYRHSDAQLTWDDFAQCL